jgi:hypothetical protein
MLRTKNGSPVTSQRIGLSAPRSYDPIKTLTTASAPAPHMTAEFTIPNMQRVMERAGFQIVGIIPASDRLLVAPGVTKRVYEAYYVKVLAADAEILRPQAKSMTPRTKALYDFLFAA